MIRRNLPITNVEKLYLSNFLTGLVFWYGIEQLFLQSIGINTILMAVNISVLALFNFVFDIPSGLLADKWSRKGTLMISAVALALSSFAYGVSTGIFTVLLATVLYGVYIVTTSGTYQALMYDSLHEQNRSDQYSKYFGRSYALFLIGATVGNVASGYIAGMTSFQVNFFVTVISCLVNMAVIASIVEPKFHKPIEDKSIVKQLGSATIIIIKKVPLMILVTITALLGVIGVFTMDYGQIYMSRYVSEVEYIGLLWAVYAFALALGNLFAHYFRNHLYIPVVLSVLPILGMTQFDSLVSVGFIFIHAFGAAALANQIDTRIQEHTPSHLRASITSVIGQLSRIIAIPASFMYGWLIFNNGVLAAVWMSATVVLLISTIWLVGKIGFKVDYQ
jgi:MFS family permease